MNFSDKDRKFIWHPFSQLMPDEPPLVVTRGEGCYLILEDNRRILDAISSWWVNLHGHANREIAKAIEKQALQLEHTIFAGFTHEPAITLAEKILSILPGNQSRIFFSDDGSTSVEVALKMSIQYWENQKISKNRIIAMEGAYHGDTFGAMAVGERGLFTKPFHSKLFNVDFILSPGLNEPEKVIKEFRKLINKDDVVAFIFEPLVQGAGGMLMHSPEVLDELISLAKEKNILCIADEIMTGFGRTGKMFAADYLVHKPDIFCLSKGLTGGTLPMGITSCSESVAEKFKERSPDKTFYHGHSFTANPISCAAALASLKILLSEECQSRISEISFQHETFHKKAGEFTRLEKARSRGTIFAIDVKTQGSREYTNPVRKKIYDFFMKKNILLRPLGNTIYILPPYIISDDQLQTIYSAIEEFNVKMN